MTKTERRALALLDWYRTNRRDLPWRGERHPWPILVSEIMLQQTSAGRVVPFYRRFMARFPTPVALADTPAAEALALWSGLGYNRRALRLQAAAHRIATDGWPSGATELQSLAGVGPYTAAAVACFAFGEQIPAPDTNMRRVLSRWYARPLNGPALTETAHRELPPGRAVDWNQAIMDLGASICRPAEPLCTECPVVQWCTGPETYAVPPPSGQFRGSSREARGAVLRKLVQQGSATLAQLSDQSGLDPRRTVRALEALVEEALVERAKTGHFRLPGS
ncbi:MAG: A/G-specific adenine glycosylase [Acidimicrobiia bacterium]